jgi:Glycosyltransferase family 87
MISLKPMVWPLALWLLATRRWRASAYTLGFGLGLNLVAWSVIGFGQIPAYLHAVAADTRDSWRLGYGLPALAGHFGLGRSAGDAALLVLSSALAIAIVYSAFVRRHELQAVIFAVALAVISSPLVWPHYFALLLVPLALSRPRLSWLWAMPVLMWVCPPDFKVHGWQAVTVWLSAATVLAVLAKQTAAALPLSELRVP